MTKTKPCRSGRHIFTDYSDGMSCATPYCGGADVRHCRKCGWYVSTCDCGFNNGLSKISVKQEKHYQFKTFIKSAGLEMNVIPGGVTMITLGETKIVGLNDPCPKEPHRHSID